MAMDMAVDFRDHDVAAMSLWLGFVRTERNEPLFQHPDAMKGPYGKFLANAESPELIGRVIDALHRDPTRMERSGHVLIVAELARNMESPKPTDDNRSRTATCWLPRRSRARSSFARRPEQTDRASRSRSADNARRNVRNSLACHPRPWGLHTESPRGAAPTTTGHASSASEQVMMAAKPDAGFDGSSYRFEKHSMTGPSSSSVAL